MHLCVAVWGSCCSVRCLACQASLTHISCRDMTANLPFLHNFVTLTLRKKCCCRTAQHAAPSALRSSSFAGLRQDGLGLIVNVGRAISEAKVNTALKMAPQLQSSNKCADLYDNHVFKLRATLLCRTREKPRRPFGTKCGKLCAKSHYQHTEVHARCTVCSFCSRASS